MRLYAGTSQHFITDTAHNQIAEKLKASFFSCFRFKPSPREVESWRNSLRAMALVLESADLKDHGIFLEYQLPLTSLRLDCMVTGRDQEKRDNAVIVELKQWSKCQAAEGENEVITFLGGAEREVLHPSAQVGQYCMYLQDNHTSFHENNSVNLNACTYLHNYFFHKKDVLLSEKFSGLIGSFPLFSGDDVDNLANYLLKKLSRGEGIEVLNRIEEGEYRPSKKLMQHVSNVIKGKPEYVLLDEQLVAYDSVLSAARKGFHDKRKRAIIINGGPGTGKSVIAINLMSDLLSKNYNAQYATGSMAFTETLRKAIGRRGAIQFKYFNSYTSAPLDAVDVLICDESHRIRKTSDNRYTPMEKRSKQPQVEELIRASKVGVFFVDNKQVVRPDEIGSSEYIRNHARDLGCDIYEYDLKVQFRCCGSETFVNWVNNTLGIEKTPQVIWNGEERFDFQIFSSAEVLERAIRGKVNEGCSARVTAGFCWKWSKKSKPDGKLEDDVAIGNYKRPWNAPHNATKLAPGIPKAQLWAYDPGGIDQIGCIYTAQGFEFDYVGVIFGNDLVYNPDKQEWMGVRANSYDSVVKRGGERFLELVKNTYRVLLSRGLKGCYVYFMDKNTERFIKSRVETPLVKEKEQIEESIEPTDIKVAYIPFRRLSFGEANPFINCVPLYDLKIAASGFSEEQQVEDFEWVELPEIFKPNKDLFVAQVVGESMNRRIPNGSWCLFRKNPVGTRQGKVVLVQHRDIHDPETGGHYTIKVYRSEKNEDSYGGWKHSKITLLPDSSMPGFKPIELTRDQAGELMVIAELVAVIA